MCFDLFVEVGLEKGRGSVIQRKEKRKGNKEKKRIKNYKADSKEKKNDKEL